MKKVTPTRRRIDKDELNKLLAMIEHLDRRYSRHWIDNSALWVEAENYVRRVKAKLPKIYEEIENGRSNRKS